MKKFMKLITVCTAAVMALGLSMTTFAATSTTTTTAVVTSTITGIEAVTASGTVVKVATLAETTKAAGLTNAAAILGASASDIYALASFELSVGTELTQATHITMTVPGVTAGQKIAVLHQKADGTWESVPVIEVANGSVTAEFTSLSPVVIVSYASPKTGETFPVVGFVFAASILGAALCVKKYAI